MKNLVPAAAVLAALALPSFASAALKVGDTAPSFTAKGSLGGKPFDFSLDAALKKGPVVLYFFPAAYTNGCTIEAHLFAEAADQYAKEGATLIGVTAGNIDRIKDFSVTECRNKFPVVADPGADIAKSYKSKMVIGWSDRVSYVVGKDHKVDFVYSALTPDQHVSKTLAAVKTLTAK
jgi:peroxiredoxin